MRLKMLRLIDASTYYNRARIHSACAGQPGGGGADQLLGLAGDQRASGASRPQQRRLAARSLGLARQARRCAAGTGQPGGGADQLPGLAGDQRASGASRPQQRPRQHDLAVNYGQVALVEMRLGVRKNALKAFQQRHYRTGRSIDTGSAAGLASSPSHGTSSGPQSRSADPSSCSSAARGNPWRYEPGAAASPADAGPRVREG
jgi:hypothetical protein